MPKHYISNSEESVRMFRQRWMEALSKVHFSVPLFIYLPVIGVFVYLAIDGGIRAASFVLYYLAGFALWTATEYLLHRFVFHYHPSSLWGQRIHFIFHGVHHDYPRDKKRLVMPPSASLPLAALFYYLFSLLVQPPHLYAFFPGFLTGYLLYDMLHYAMHHYNFKSGLMKRIKQHHMLHHYQDPEKGFGVSSSVWDVVLRTQFLKRAEKLEQEG